MKTNNEPESQQPQGQSASAPAREPRKPQSPPDPGFPIEGAGGPADTGVGGGNKG